MPGPLNGKVQSAKKNILMRLRFILPALILAPLALACGSASSGNPPTPQRSLSCAEGQTGWVDVDNGFEESVNIYAFVVSEPRFVGIARPGKTTLPMPKGAKRAYVGGHTATDIPIHRTGVDAAVRFEYRCE